MYAHTRARLGRRAITAVLIAAGCSEREASGPTSAPPPVGNIQFDVTGGPVNGSFSQGPTRLLIKGFNHTNPRHGDAVVATFFWLGSTNVIDSVTDVITTFPFTPVRNKYHLVDYVTSGGVSMATYVATNVKGFPDGVTDSAGSGILAVRADLSQPVHGGLMLSSYGGVYPLFPQALEARRSASGTGAVTAVASAGPVGVRAGGLAYGVTMANAAVPLERPPGFTNILTMSDALIAGDGEFAVQPISGAVEPRWTWHFEQSPAVPRTWLATVLTLNQAPTKLVFTTQPTNGRPCPKQFSPKVRVAAVDDKGNLVRAFDGEVTINLKRNVELLRPGRLPEPVAAKASKGVVTFDNLCVQDVGDYTLVATSSVGDLDLGAESAPFAIMP
jgi:hypothetical protein